MDEREPNNLAPAHGIVVSVAIVVALGLAMLAFSIFRFRRRSAYLR